MNMRSLMVMGTLLLFGTAGGTAAELTDENFEHWKQYIQPTAEELQWQEIQWETSFWDAVRRAQREDKPILMWAMNGHPLACT
jgi:hypothetical protein